MEGEEIGDEETDDEGDEPDRQAELQGRQIGLEGDAEIGKLVDAAFENLHIAARRERRQDLIFVVVPKAHHHGEPEGNEEEDHEHGRKRRDLQPCRNSAGQSARRRGRGRDAFGGREPWRVRRARRRSPAGTDILLRPYDSALPRALPLPLAGEGRGGGASAVNRRSSCLRGPLPNPPQAGEGEPRPREQSTCVTPR